MPFTRHLSPERIFELHAAALALDRMALLGGMDAAFVATLPDLPNGTPSDRLLATLHRLNAVETLGDGSVPMRSWLLNARSLARGRGETDEDIFVDALAALGKPSSPPRATARGSREERRGDPRAAEIRRLSKQREEQVAKGSPVDEITSEIRRLKREQRTGPDLAAGDTLSDGRYELVEHLGKGGVGTVWKAHDHETGSSVAVKFLLADEGQHVLDRFRRGARCMAKLNHPNVVRVLQAASVDDVRGRERWFFVMELLSGGTLHRRVVKGQWGRDRALRAVIEAGFGLSCAHQEKMIHRDVSPDNILIDHAGKAKLTDFDLVKAEDTTGLTKTHQPMGKTFYMAPELWDGAKHADERSDVFALGMTALFAAYGKALPHAVIGKREKFFARLDCPKALKAVLDRATDSEPEERHASVAELCAAIEEAIGNEPSTVSYDPSLIDEISRSIPASVSLPPKVDTPHATWSWRGASAADEKELMTTHGTVRISPENVAAAAMAGPPPSMAFDANVPTSITAPLTQRPLDAPPLNTAPARAASNRKTGLIVVAAVAAMWLLVLSLGIVKLVWNRGEAASAAISASETVDSAPNAVASAEASAASASAAKPAAKPVNGSKPAQDAGKPPPNVPSWLQKKHSATKL